MGHDHSHDHVQPHSHEHACGEVHTPHAHEPDELTRAALSDTADAELAPAELSRRRLLLGAGLGGASLAAGMAGMVGVSPAMADDDRVDERHAGGGRARYWLAGDHHIHTQHSSDGQYTVMDQAQHAAAYGLDWLVITDHGGATHARIGVDVVNPDILAARDELRGTLIFQGLEWNIPSAEHGTVFVAPGRHEVAVLKQFETDYDGSVAAVGLGGTTAEKEALAVAGIQWLGQQVDRRRVEAALFLANHPARNGIDSPHEIRAWRDADPRVAIGFEGAPGHQAAGLPAGYGPGSARGFYGNAARPDSFAAYPPESYRTWGGFDWMTSTVGGLWDSLLAEGKPWSISANSDSHVNWSDTSQRPVGQDSAAYFAENGRYGDPEYAGRINLTAGDFWPGFYSRTHVGAASRSYTAVMRGMRDGRIWVDHGALVKSVDVSVRERGRRGAETTLGGTAVVRRGASLELVVKVVPQDVPNWSQFVPRLNRVDVIRGAVDPDHAGDRDTFTAPDTRVVEQWDTAGRTEPFEIVHDLGRADEPFYVRLRGTDGNRQQPGALGAAIDPAGPAIDVIGAADPWADLWFYTNPIWVLPRGR